MISPCPRARRRALIASAHLVDVVDLVLHLETDGAGRAPVQLLGARARVEAPEENDDDHPAPDDREHDERNGSTGGRVYARGDR